MSNNVKRVFVMDMENTNNFGFLTKYEITKKDEVVLFLSDKSKPIVSRDLQYIIDNKINLKSEFVSVGTKNAMDFQIVSYISLNIKSNREYYIVSDDKGYDTVIDYMATKTNRKIQRITQNVEEIKDIAIVEILNSIPGDDDFKNKLKQINFKDRVKVHNTLVSEFGEKGKEIYQLVKPVLTA